jgi:hypothetical protein
LVQVGPRLMLASIKFLTSTVKAPIHLTLTQANLTDAQMDEMFKTT